MGCSDILSDVWEFIEDTVKNVVDVVVDVVTDIWRELVMPILEEVFALLGFEGKIIVNSYAQVRPLYSNGWISPFKKAVINRLAHDTDLMEEIKSIFLVGDHVRIRKYLKYGLANNLTPQSYFLFNSINVSAVQIIIEADVAGEPVTLLTAIITTPNKFSYCNKYLLENSVTTGYDYQPFFRELTDTATGAVYVLSYDDPFVFDAIFDGYDIETYLINDMSITIKTALNVVVDVTDTFNVDDGVTQTVTIDTAQDNYTEVLVDEIIVVNTTSTTLQNVIPAQTQPATDAQPTHYEVSYVLDSDPDIVLWWFYDMIENDTTYPDLYADRSNLPEDSDPNYVVLPIAKIKQDDYWLEDFKTGDEYIKTNKLLKKFGLDVPQLTKPFKDPGDGGDTTDIVDIFFMFGINLSLTDSEASLTYLWNFFDDLLVNTSTDSAEIVAFNIWKTEYDTLNLHAASDFVYNHDTNTYDGPPLSEEIYVILEKYSPSFKIIRDNPIPDPDDDGEIACPIPRRDIIKRNFTSIGCLSDYESAAIYWQEGLDVARSSNKWNASFLVQSDTYNGSFNYGPAIRETGITNPVELFEFKDIEKEIVIADVAYILRKRDGPASTTHTKLTIYNLTGFNLVTKGTDTASLTALDFLGDDAGGTNVADNFLLPITYAHLDELGIVDRQQVIAEAAQIVIYSYIVTELDWYETAAFLKFFDFVLKVAAVVYIFFTGDPSGAEIIWGAVKYYGAKLAVEKIIQYIILKHPDSDLAIAVAVAFAIASGTYGGVNNAFDIAMTSLHATSQVATTYVQVKSDILAEDYENWTEDRKEEQERLEKAFDDLGGDNQGLIDYIKKQVTIKVEHPEAFLSRTLTIDPSDEFLDIANRLDLDFIFEDSTHVITNNYT